MFESAVMGPTVEGGALPGRPLPPRRLDRRDPFPRVGEHKINKPQLAEALVFYDQIHLIGDVSRFIFLITNMGLLRFRRLLESNELN